MNDTDTLGGSILGLIAEDKDLIVYRKSLRALAGSVTATILLQQMIFRMKKKDHIYKFKTPCDYELYRVGDSWIEELGFSIREFDTALKMMYRAVNREAGRDTSKGQGTLRQSVKYAGFSSLLKDLNINVIVWLRRTDAKLL